VIANRLPFLPILALALVAAPNALACLCSPPPVDQAVQQVALVFAGKIVKIDFLEPKRQVPDTTWPGEMRTIPRRMRLGIKVSASWKGQVGRVIDLYAMESDGGASCTGFDARLGENMIFFADRIAVTKPEEGIVLMQRWYPLLPAGTVIATPAICSLTAKIRNAAAILKNLGSPSSTYPK